ncbi:MAG: UDP-N-acetylmuramoyl-L-alanine--D-glutamate ligase [Deltaproteobacteria bacterium]|nr:UDP-N-acetylmuramoyl-L-alanine--D-glutamate ligase [Deltaproteobacteria bacterium]
MDLNHKNILIVGLGISGIAAARFVQKKGASVTVTDMADEKKLGSYASMAHKLGVNMELGKHNTETFERSDLIVVSPGVPHTILPIKRALSKGIPVLGELELAARYIREPVGNIGNPLIDYAGKRETADIVVAEVSSFQLDTIDTFRPHVGVLLNITADHLDRYPDFKSYVKSKNRLFENQRQTDIAVLNGSDPILGSIIKDLNARKLLFRHQENSQAKDRENALISRGNSSTPANITIRMKGRQKISFDLSGTNFPGLHNLENAAAASLAAIAVGGTPEGVKSALKNFKGLPHRIEYIETINHVRFFDDSKATNVDAVIRALETFGEPIILIMGGRDKGGDFRRLLEPVQQHIKKLILMGEAKDKIISVLEETCKERAQTASTMEDAVFSAYGSASPGDIVLLSPGCSSFDMYSSYAERGEDFCRAIGNLKKVKRKKA